MQAEKGGALSSRSTHKQRLVLALAAAVTIVLAPLTILRGTEAVPAASAGTSVTAQAMPSPAVRHLTEIALADARVTTTTAGSAPRAVPPTTQAPSVTAPPTTAPTVVSPAPGAAPSSGGGYSGRVASGQATFYGAPEGSCASQIVPRGSTVKVTNQATGAWITCVVNDYEQAVWPRVIDLSAADFDRLASQSAGVISVTIEW